MSLRPTRHRRVFRLESLEIRTAPSHFGAVAHAVALHHAHSPAVVRHFNESASADKNHLADKNSGVEPSTDKSIETAGHDQSNSNSSSNDPTSVDLKSAS